MSEGRSYTAGESWGQLVAWLGNTAFAGAVGSDFQPVFEDQRLVDMGMVLDQLGGLVPAGAAETLVDLSPLCIPLLVALREYGRPR